VRFLIKPAKDMALWSAFSRSITTPGYIQTKMELHLAEIPYITPETAAAIADQYGLTGEARIGLSRKILLHRFSCPVRTSFS